MNIYHVHPEKFVTLLLAAIFIMLSGCSSLKVVPEQAESGILNLADNSQTITRNGVEIRAAVSDTEINAYNLDGTVTAFHLVIRNNTKSELAYNPESFVLTDERGLQYELLTPDRVREILKKDSYYLMPYPYAGFYYQEDYVKTSFYNRTMSALPYYYELYPQDIYTRALPMTTVIPGMMIEGLVYFKIDLSTHSKIYLHIYRKGASKSSNPDFIFPFKIVK